MRLLLLAVVLCCLAACGDDGAQDLREPGAEGPLHITIWDLEQGRHTKVEASSVDLLGANFETMHLQSPRIRMPVKNGIIWLATAEAIIDQGTQQEIKIDALIHLQGEIDGRPLHGTAQSMHLNEAAKHCDLSEADFIWGAKHVTAQILRIRSGAVLSGEGWREEPVQEKDTAAKEH